MAMHPLESSVHQALFDALRSQVETHLNDRILDYADGWLIVMILPRRLMQ